MWPNWANSESGVTEVGTSNVGWGIEQAVVGRTWGETVDLTPFSCNRWFIAMQDWSWEARDTYRIARKKGSLIMQHRQLRVHAGEYCEYVVKGVAGPKKKTWG